MRSDSDASRIALHMSMFSFFYFFVQFIKMNTSKTNKKGLLCELQCVILTPPIRICGKMSCVKIASINLILKEVLFLPQRFVLKLNGELTNCGCGRKHCLSPLFAIKKALIKAKCLAKDVINIMLFLIKACLFFH